MANKVSSLLGLLARRNKKYNLHRVKVTEYQIYTVMYHLSGTHNSLSVQFGKSYS